MSLPLPSTIVADSVLTLDANKTPASIPYATTSTANAIVRRGADGKIDAASIPAIALTTMQVVANQAARLAVTAQAGDVVKQTDTGLTYMLATGGDPTVNGDWIEITANDAETAAGVAFTPAGTIAANTVQAAIEEVASDAAALVTDHTGDASAAHAASAIAFTPAGTIAATEVQAAIEEVASEAANADNLTSGTVPDARMPAELTPLLTLGTALQQIRVNAAGTALEFFTP